MNKEGKVVVASTILTTTLVSGFTLSQAPILASDEYKRIEHQKVVLKNIEDNIYKQEDQKREISKEIKLDEKMMKDNDNTKKYKKTYVISNKPNQQISISSQFKPINQQEESEKPIESENLEKPQEKPEKPTEPEISEKPQEKPEKPTEPEISEKPQEKPEKPTEPEIPEKPQEKPEKPAEPEIPEKPQEKPEKPAEPEIPEKPQIILEELVIVEK